MSAIIEDIGEVIEIETSIFITPIPIAAHKKTDEKTNMTESYFLIPSKFVLLVLFSVLMSPSILGYLLNPKQFVLATCFASSS